MKHDWFIRMTAYLQHLATCVRSRAHRRRNDTRSRVERFQHLLKCLAWVGEEFYSSPSEETTRHLSRFLMKVGKIWVFRGLPEAINYVKGIRECYLFALSDPYSKRTYQARRRLGRAFGWTKDAAALDQESPEVIRFLLTALTLLRSETVKPVLDVAPIIEPSKNILRFDRWKRLVALFWRRVNSRAPRDVRRCQPKWSEFHLTTKRGPGGGQALLEATENLYSLPDSLVSSIARVGGPELVSHMLRLKDGRDLVEKVLGPHQEVPIRKLTVIPDKEGKSRVVGILDYYSQSALYPLHDLLYRYLRTIPQDMTFDQGAFRDQIKSWPKGEWYSVDLSKATDRFPMSLIRFVMEGRFDKEFVDSWSDIMVGYPFSSDCGEVRYNCGNPMGAYSSWASFAVAHHFVVFLACEFTGRRWESLQYALLGDDILIGDPVVGSAYRDLVTLLGVETSPTKSYTSSRVCEFAKRWFYRGEEVTPFPVSSIANVTRSIPLLVASVEGAEKKGLFARSGVPGSVGKLVAMMSRPSSRWSRRKPGPTLTEKATLRAARCQWSTQFLQGSLSAQDFIRFIGSPVRGLGVGPEGDLGEEICHLIIKGVMCELLGISLSKGDNSFMVLTRSMWGRAQRSTETATGWPHLASSVPFWSVYERIGALGNQMEFRLDDVSSLSREDLEIAIRGLHGPLSSHSFGLSKRERRIQAGARLGYLVANRIRTPDSILEAIQNGVSRPFTRALLRTCAGVWADPIRWERCSNRLSRWRLQVGRWRPLLALALHS